MMRAGAIVPLDWVSVCGPSEMALPDLGQRRVTVEVITGGCNIFLSSWNGDGEVRRLLVWSGFGRGGFSFVAGSGQALSVSQGEGEHSSLHIPELRSMEVAWRRTASFADMEPKRPGTISAEMQAVIDQMNRNAIRREAIMMQALKNRTL